MRDALAYCRRRKHLRRTLKTGLIVGVILTLINQSGVLLDGAATTATYVRCGLNFVVPFVVSNVGLLSGRSSSERDHLEAAGHKPAHARVVLEV